MFQSNFLLSGSNPRTDIAILFFALAMMILFNDKIDPLKKRILFIVFMASCILSHYSTTYVFFFIMLVSFLGMELLSKKYTFKKEVSLTIIVLFFALIFLWYSQVTKTAFTGGVCFIQETIGNLNMFFIEESRETDIQAMFGKDIVQKGIPHMIEFVLSWLTFAFIGTGIITLIIRYKEMSFSELNFKKPNFLKEKFEVIYFTIALFCSGLLVMVVALPFISVGYSMQRLYAVALTILSVFFVIGGIIIAKTLSLDKNALLKKEKEKENIPQQTFKGDFASERGGKGSDVWAYLIILLVLIPYFFCVSGVMYNMFGVQRSVLLNSEGKQYDYSCIHDQESFAAKWLAMNSEKNTRVYYAADSYGWHRLISQGKIASGRIDTHAFYKREKGIKGFIYLSYNNVIHGKFGIIHKPSNMSEYSDMFVGVSRVYSSGGSEIWEQR
jgi:uncharacterized membrane protein